MFLVGEATDAETPTHTETTATFKTNLVSPGDSMQYDITVENQGDIDAVLESIDVNTSDNAAILFEATGIKRGDKLLPDESDILTVTVTYNPDVTSQPENLNATVTVTLNYVQDNGTVLPEPDPIDIGGIEVMPVTSGDGLYGDEYTSGRYVYRGTNPNNYIMFNNELWRIISKKLMEHIRYSEMKYFQIWHLIVEGQEQQDIVHRLLPLMMAVMHGHQPQI